LYYILSSDDSKGRNGCIADTESPRIMTTHSVMVKGPSVFTRDLSCYRPSCFHAADNSFVGGCTRRRETKSVRQKTEQIRS
ncbi:hypothetical protein LSAT2_024093, partial [Lamellibrachia satsuma]